MNMINTFKNFANDESGAVTVDWVVLTAAVVGLGLIVVNAARPRIENAATVIADDIQNATEIGR